MTLTAVRGHDLEARDLHELTLERRRDAVRHRLWRRAGVAHADLDNRVVDRGQIVHRQVEVGEHAEEDDGGGQHDRHHRTTNEGFGEAHGCSAGCDGLLATRTFAPGVSAS